MRFKHRHKSFYAELKRIRPRRYCIKLHIIFNRNWSGRNRNIDNNYS